MHAAVYQLHRAHLRCDILSRALLMGGGLEVRRRVALRWLAGVDGPGTNADRVKQAVTIAATRKIYLMGGELDMQDDSYKFGVVQV